MSTLTYLISFIFILFLIVMAALFWAMVVDLYNRFDNKDEPYWGGTGNTQKEDDKHN
jgi:heme/copper-type cytochrome/quinol oxidase subunit 2